MLTFNEIGENDEDFVVFPVSKDNLPPPDLFTAEVAIVEEAIIDLGNLLNHPLYGTDMNNIYYPYNSESKIKDIMLFQDIKYTEEQKSFLVGFSNDFNNFVHTFDQTERILLGYSGTGKSTITFAAVSYSLQYSAVINNVILLAPTNRAKLVLSNKLGTELASYVKISTVHSLLYGKPTKSEDSDESIFVLKDTKITNSLILIDECSMLTNTVIEDIRKRTENCYILYIGDSFQLEPIGEVSNVFELSGWKLTEVKRNNSSILKLATLIRTHKKNFYFNKDTEDIKNMTQNDATHYFIRHFDEFDSLYNIDTIFIVATNEARIRFTNYVRSILYEDGEPLHLKEKLIAVSNSSFYTNGEMIIVNDYEILQEIDFNVVTKYRNEEEYTETYYGYLCLVNSIPIIFMPEIKEASLSTFKLNDCNIKRLIKPEFYKLFLKEVPTSIKSYGQQEYHNPEYFNVFSPHITIATYGYSCSAHKVQGSEAENIFVFQNYCNANWDSAKWFYTAMTRASKKLIIIPNRDYQTAIPLNS